MKKFYSHLVAIETVHTEIDALPIEQNEKDHLKALASSNLHQAILDAVLSELNETDKKIFLKLVEKNQHEELWSHLTNKVDGIEEKIKKVAIQLQDELRNDIKDVQK